MYWNLTAGMVAALRAVSRWLVVGGNACVSSTSKAQLWVTEADGPRCPDVLIGYEVEIPDECDGLEIWSDDAGVHVKADGVDTIYLPSSRVVKRSHKSMPSAWLAAFAQESIAPERGELVMERSRLRFEFRG